MGANERNHICDMQLIYYDNYCNLVLEILPLSFLSCNCGVVKKSWLYGVGYSRLGSSSQYSAGSKVIKKEV